MSEDNIETIESVEIKKLRSYLKRAVDRKKEAEEALNKKSEDNDSLRGRISILEEMVNTFASEKEILEKKIIENEIIIKNSRNIRLNCELSLYFDSLIETDSKCLSKTELVTIFIENESKNVGMEDNSETVIALEKQIEYHKKQGGKMKGILKNLQAENEKLKEENSRVLEEQLMMRQQFESNSIQAQAHLETIQSLRNEIIGDKKLIEDLKQEMKTNYEQFKSFEEDRLMFESEKHQLTNKITKCAKDYLEQKRICRDIEMEKQELTLSLKMSMNRELELQSLLEQTNLKMAEIEKILHETENQSKQNDSEKLQMVDQIEIYRNSICELTIQRDFYENRIKQIERKRASIRLYMDSNHSHSIYDLDKEPLDITHKMSYLQKLLIEFFSQDNKSRTLLLPTILLFIGCPEYQVEQAKKSWENSLKNSSRLWF